MTELLEVRYQVNKWVSDNFPMHRQHISHAVIGQGDGAHRVELQKKTGKEIVRLGELRVRDGGVDLTVGTVGSVIDAVDAAEEAGQVGVPVDQSGSFYDFRFGDGIKGAAALVDRSVDLLLTDPPYSISKAYTCETQVPRRSRKNGADFIMPKGHFGDWDNRFPLPPEWTGSVLRQYS